ncbi:MULTISPECIES: DUF5667 domain-containing protein [Streptomyces]|uniref:DUF5667 domain-containing protein n=1 Tax=Streptomyces TaxID=1883 RepID=UPI00140856AB|nr:MULTISPECIES: DUF5667 domain-containing protein [Streptomyces]MDH6225707.1 hypothetical protein [Streptomyces sp. MJP52]
MIANVSAHRRANAFAQALEELSDRGTAAEQPEGSAAPAPAAAEETGRTAMLAVAAGLGELPKPELDPEVKAVQRAQLVAAMEAMVQEGALGGDASSRVPDQRSTRARGAHRASALGKLRPRSRLTKGLAAGGLSVGVAASAFGGVAAASSDALPGDSLYGLKRGIEDFRLGLTEDGTERGEMLLDQASRRLTETRRLMERGRGGHLDHESVGEIRRALSGMHQDAAEGHRLLHDAYRRDPDSLAPMRALSAFTDRQGRTWDEVRERLPVQLGDVSEEVTSVFDAMEQDVAPLRPLLPEAPSSGGRDARPGQDAGTRSPGSSPSGESTAPGKDEDGTGSTGSRDGGEPEASPSADPDGLLGGGTGGLFDPPAEEEQESDPTRPESEDDGRRVTLPPLLPGLLPGLGLGGDSAE